VISRIPGKRARLPSPPDARGELIAAWAPVALMLAVIAVLSLQSRANLRQNMGWLSLIPQHGRLKLRHFPEFAPLAFLTALALERTSRLGTPRAAGFALLAALGTGALSEAAQTFMPGRNGCALDVLSDVLAASAGLAVYAVLRAALKRWPGGRLERFFADLPLLALLLGAVALNCLPPLNWPICYDGWRLLTAFSNPGSHAWGYWLRIFTHATNGPQYRPLSFFVVFYEGRRLFGDDILVYRLVGAAFAFATAAVLFHLARRISGSRFFAFAAALWFCLHAAVPMLLFVISDAEKYFFPAFVLASGLLVVYGDPRGSRRGTLWLFVSSTLAILSHEGAFVFPLLFIGLDWALGRKPAARHLLLGLPGLAYLAGRLAVGVPAHGFMAVGLGAAPEAAARYLSFVFFPEIVQSRLLPRLLGPFCRLLLGSALLALGTAICGLLWWKRSERLPAFFWLSMLLVLGPFAVLKNHFLLSRALWSLTLLPLLLASLYRATGARLALRTALGLLLVVELFLNLASYRRYDIARGILAGQGRLEALIAGRLPPPGAALEIESPAVARVFDQMLAGFLAYRFPRRTFLLSRTGTANAFAYVAGGTFFNELGGRWYDSFGVPARVEPPRARRTLFLPTELLDCLAPGYEPLRPWGGFAP
jgi:VanZ family protein